VAEALDVSHLGALFEGLAFGGHDLEKGREHWRRMRWVQGGWMD
jgi:hypothetical protein